MRGGASTMTVFRPRDAHEALRMLAERPDALVIAGGTDVMVGWNLGLLNDRAVLDLSRLEEWTRIERTPAGLRIGALVTHAALRDHPLVREQFGLLSAACATVGGVQIQNRGTIGGNIANASPAGDTLPPLAVYGARVIASRAGADGGAASGVGTGTGVRAAVDARSDDSGGDDAARGDALRGDAADGRGDSARTIAFADLFAGVKRTTLRPGELISAIELPFPTPASAPALAAASASVSPSASVSAPAPAGAPASAVVHGDAAASGAADAMHAAVADGGLSHPPARVLFRKVGTRAAQAISKTVAAGLVWLSPDGVVIDARLALGSMAPTVRRLPHVERALIGQRLTPALAREAAAQLSLDVSPIDDVRSTAVYRLTTAQRVIEQFLASP